MKKYVHGGDVYRYPQVMDFSANINPLGTPEAVIRAAQDSMLQVAHYPDAHQERLKKALSEYEQVPEKWLICGNGAAELIFVLAQTLKPKKALIPAPTFAEYEQALKGVGCEILYEKLKEENGFRMGTEIFDHLTEDLDIFFLCNPNNPTGLLIDGILLDQIVEICREKEIWLVVDECFLDFVKYSETHTLKGTLEPGRKLFILKAFTKIYAMAGLRLGYGICAEEAFLDQMEQHLQPWNVSIPAQEAGIAALREKEYVKKAIDLIEKERRYFIQELGKIGYYVYDSQANYIFFKADPELHRKLLEEKVMIRDCSNYPGLSVGYYRIAVRTHEENEKLLDAIRKVRE